MEELDAFLSLPRRHGCKHRRIHHAGAPSRGRPARGDQGYARRLQIRGPWPFSVGHLHKQSSTVVCCNIRALLHRVRHRAPFAESWILRSHTSAIFIQAAAGVASRPPIRAAAGIARPHHQESPPLPLVASSKIRLTRSLPSRRPISLTLDPHLPCRPTPSRRCPARAPQGDPSPVAARCLRRLAAAHRTRSRRSTPPQAPSRARWTDLPPQLPHGCGSRRRPPKPAAENPDVLYQPIIAKEQDHTRGTKPFG